MRRPAPPLAIPTWGEEDMLFAADGSGKPVKSVFPPRRLRLLRLLAAGALAILLVQGLRLQITAGSLFRNEAEQNRVREFIEYAPRGIFLDRFGTPLVQNIPSVDLVAEPSRVPEDSAPLLTVLAEALRSRDLSAIQEQLSRLNRQSNFPQPLLAGLSHEEFLAVSSRADRLPGIRTETTATRQYAGNGPFAHVLGYTGKLSPEERPAFPDYVLTENIGKAGLEQTYERLLRGQHGARRVEVDAHGNVQHELGRQPATPGSNLRLHLDSALQEVVAAALARGAAVSGGAPPGTPGVRRGAVVALDPFSGSVRSLVSLPTFPHSDLARGQTEVVRSALTDPAASLLNRVTQGQYVPGSSFKIAVASAALEERVVSPATSIRSTGGIRVGQWFFPDWKAGGHGQTALTKALAESVNTYFYTIGGGFGDFPRALGIERITAWAKKLGLGEPTGIDLPEEANGLLPSPAWKERAKGERWYIGDTYHAAIGQGDVLVTPLQLAVMASTVANGGTVYAPRLLEAVIGLDGTVRERSSPRVRAESVITPETAAAVRAGMRSAVETGSAQGLLTLPIAVAAKTGTAEIGGTDKTHAWVTVIAPFQKPELVLVVLLEEAGGGDRVAVPVAREILAWYFSPERVAARRKSM